jgi:hypothetical protein
MDEMALGEGGRQSLGRGRGCVDDSRLRHWSTGWTGSLGCRMDENGCRLLFGCWAITGAQRGEGLGADSRWDAKWNGQYGSGVGR